MKLYEKASIDWNNYLKPEEVQKFLQKDDKVESAEEIVYSKDFRDRLKEFKKSGWIRRDLAYDLANFYEQGNLLTEAFRRSKQINSYINIIVEQLFPALEQQLGIKMSNNPINLRPMTASFTGRDFKDSRIILDFSTIHKDLEKISDTALFSNAYYGMKGDKVGTIDLADIQGSVDMIKNALYDIGFRTEAELSQEEKDKVEKEKQEKKAQEDKIKAAKAAKEREREVIEYNKSLNDNPKEQNNEEDDIKTFSETLDDCMNELAKRNEPNSSIYIKYVGKDEEFAIEAFYITNRNYLVKCEDIGLDQVMNRDSLEEYLDNLSKEYKVTACNTYTAPGEKTPEKGLSTNLFFKEE